MELVAETLNAGEELIRCLQVTLGTCPSARLSSLAPDQWTRVTDLALKSGVAPILFRGLPVADPSLGIPKDILSRWLQAYIQSAARNNRLSNHLKQILGRFNHEDIPVILLKGIHLMDALYEDRGMRTVGDIDLLIHPQDRNRARHGMQELGYTPINSEVVGCRVHCGYVHPKSRLMVEIHFELETGTARKLAMADFWERSQQIQVNGQKARTLALDDLLVHLCLHLTHHLLGVVLFPPGLRSLYDIALLIRQHSDRMSWERVQQMLCQAHGEKHLSLPVALADELLNIPPPAALAAYLHGALTIPSDDIEVLRKHLLISCQQEIVNARMPKFVRSSVMANKANILLGFLRRVFVSRAELERRYTHSPQQYGICWKYFVHFRSLIKGNFAPAKWAWGPETFAFTKHFRNMATLKDRIAQGE